MMRLVAYLALFAMFNQVFLPSAVTCAQAAESSPKYENMIQEALENAKPPVLDNPKVGLDDQGFPIGSGRGMTPAQQNPLLGATAILSPLECAKRYGVQFCACTTLDNGEQACYHQTPAAGYYDITVCEKIWGAGQCVCDDQGSCRYQGGPPDPEGLACLDQVFFFPGEQFECRQAGVLSMGADCCKENDEMDSACSFKNLGSKVGMGDIIQTAISIGMTIDTLSGLTGTSFSEMAAQKIGQAVVQSYIEEGAMGVLGELASLFGDEVAKQAMDALQKELAQQGANAAVEAAAQEAAATAVAEVLGTAISVASWAYTIYRMYNLYKNMQECTAAELMLGCKIAKKTCHRVGSRCKIKVAGHCLQRNAVYCCFNTQLARIIHEQGRPQLERNHVNSEMSWGSAKSPNCRGFYMDEFMSLDFAAMDLGEYAEELVKQMSKDMAPKIEKATKNAMESWGMTN